MSFRLRKFWWLLALLVLLLNIVASAAPFLDSGPRLIAGIIVMTIPALLPSVILAAALGALACWRLRRGGVVMLRRKARAKRAALAAE